MIYKWIIGIGTASLVYAGADTLFKKFASMRDSWKTVAVEEKKDETSV